MRIDRFQDLFVWQIADELRREIVAFTDRDPAAKDFKFRDQIRDAIASACRNTAEGFDRFRPAEFARSLEYARGSLGEVQDCLIDGHNRGYIDGDQFDRLWLLSKRASGSNTKLTLYLKNCAAKRLTPWILKEPRGKGLPAGERRSQDATVGTPEKSPNQNQEPEPGT
jgi:four helix bundle protein